MIQSLFTYAGANVEAAQEGLRLAQIELSRAEAGGDRATINRAKAALVDAQSRVRDAQLQTALESYQFMYDMDKINAQQFIAYLKELEKIPGLTQQQIHDLERQIKSLRDSLGQDYQFNLPSDLGLPTLYEARRLNQSDGNYQTRQGLTNTDLYGGGYQDNRNIQINIVANNSIDAKEALNLLVDTLQQPSRYGSRVRVI